MKKLNTILIIVLIILLGSVGFLGFMLFKQTTTVKAPALTNASLTEVNTWCESLKSNPCKIEFEYSDTVEKDMVIYQSIKEGEKIDDSISFTVSLGKNPSIALPLDLTGMSKEEAIKWATDNNLVNITYKEEENENIPLGFVIRIESSINPMFEDTPVTIVVSSGSKDVPVRNLDGTFTVKSKDYVGLSLSQFETKIKKLGLVPVHDEDRDTYSESVNKGLIVWHGSGEYVENENITYGLSLGKKGDSITVKANQYTKKSVADFESAVKDLGLVPSKTSEFEDYSNTVEKGKILWHGSGEYEKGEKIRYSVSLGKKSDSDDLYVARDTYQGKTVEEFETAVKALGLVPSKTKDFEDYSDNVPAGKILWHGCGDFENGETIRYSLSLGKKGDDTPVVVVKGSYVGKTVTDFENTVKALGLVPVKTEEKEAHSETVVAGYILWHGSGTYVKGENIRYSVSLGSENASSTSITISSGTYVGKTVSEFETIARNMGLVPKKTTEHDAYSDTVAAGNIIWHGSGTYVNGEDFRYSVSLGKQNTATTFRVEAGTYSGYTVSEFESAVRALGLVPSKTTEHDSFSDTVSVGNIVWHGNGNFTTGETIRYSVSKGPSSTATLGTFADLSSIIYDSTSPSFASSKSNIESYLNRAGFTNYTVEGRTSNDSGAGVLLSISVDGVNHSARRTYATTANIVVLISTGNNS